MRVLLIEDDPSTSQMIELILASEKIICDIAEYGEDGILTTKINDYDLLILDLVLPDMTGFDVLKSLRNDKIKVPVLILSGLTDSEEKIKGLGFGADDYLTKPFNKGELVARVKAIIRRSQGFSESKISIANLEINLDSHSTFINSKPVHLTSKEQKVLEILALKKGHPVSKETFFAHLYNGIDEPEIKIIDVFVCKMRKKLYDISGGINYIETVWGRGYSLKEPKDIPANQQTLDDDDDDKLSLRM